MNGTLLRLLVFRQLRTSPLRSFLMVLGIALGVALSTAISLINRSTLASFRQSVDAVTGKAALTLTAGEAGFLESTLEELKAYREIRAAVPMTENPTYYKTAQGKFEPLQILGIDLLKETSVRTYRTDDDQIIEDPLVFLNQPDSVILTREFADRHSIELDEKIELTTAFGIRTLTVRGLLSPSGPAKAFGGSIGIMDIDGARFTFGKEGRYDRIDLVLREKPTPEAIAGLANRIETELKNKIGAQFAVQRPETQSENFEKMVASYQGMLSFLSLLALVVGVFLVFNTVAVSVAERRREIGTVRALGGKKPLILGLILMESACIGVVSSVLGFLIGKILGDSLLGEVVKGMSTQFGTLIRVQHLLWGAPDLARAAVAGTVATVAAALLPAWNATRIPPVEALRPKGLGDADSTSVSLQVRRVGGAWVGVGIFAYLATAAFFELGKHAPWLEFLNPPLGVLGAVLLAPSGVLAAIRLFSHRGRHSSDGSHLLSRLAMENLLRSSRRTSANVLSLIIGLMLVITISAIHVSFKQTLMNWSQTIMSVGDIMISQNGRVAQLQVQPIHPELLHELAELPGVNPSPDRAVIGIRYLKIDYTLNREKTLRLALKAFDPPAAEALALPPEDPRAPKFRGLDAIRPSAPEQGRALFASTEPRTIISESLAGKSGKTVGDVLRLATPSGSEDFKIVGIVRDFASPDGVIYLNRKVYQHYWKDPLITAAMVSAAPGTSPEKLKERIDTSLGRKYGVVSVLNTELGKQVVSLVDEGFAFNRAIQMASLLVGLLGLMNTLLIGLLERTREIGLFRAVGMTRSQLSVMLLWECVIQGVLGAVVAVFFGGVLSYFWIQGTLSHLLGWVIQFHFPLAAVAQVLVTGTLVAALAGILPAYRAARLQIRDALEYE